MKSGIIAGLLSVMFLASIVAAAPQMAQNENGLNHRDKTSHLYLFEKDSEWNIVEGGAWGKMTYNDEFVFNGHGLEVGTEYTLLRYNGDVWPTVECLAEGIANNGGNVNLAGEIGSYGDKVWLVLSSDVDCDIGEMTAWNPAEYLFENNLI